MSVVRLLRGQRLIKGESRFRFVLPKVTENKNHVFVTIANQPPPPPPPLSLPRLFSKLTTISSPPPPDLLILFAAAISFHFLLKSHSPPPPPRKISMKPSSYPSNSLSFSSPESLADFLKPLIPSSSSWGSLPGSKTLHNLFLELHHGETTLHPEPIRTVHVATLKIKNPRTGAHLMESHQLMSDGTLRRRMRPLSEKMRPGEDIQAAAERAVGEELGPHVAATVRMGTYAVTVEERDSSVSYPGLPARYVLHSVEAEVEGVPEEGEFETEEGGEGNEEAQGAVFVRRHFWKWVEEEHHAGSGS